MSRTAGEVNKRWADYLETRPEFRKWCDYQLDKKTEDHPEWFPTNRNTRELGVLSEDNINALRRISSSYVEGILRIHDSYGRPTIVSMNDRTALWYSVNGGLAIIHNKLKKLVKNVAKQRIGFDEAKWIASQKTSDSPIIDVLCAREDGLEPGSNESRKHADLARNLIGNQPGRPQKFFRVWHAMNTTDTVHPLWTNMDSFIGTVCKYSDYVNILRNYDYLNNSDDPIIDRKYLDTVVLSDRPDTKDISIDDWHSMTAKLLDRTIEVRHQIDAAYSYYPYGLRISRIMVRALSCFIGIGHGPEELTFMETVYGFISGLDKEYGNALYEAGTLDHTSFDILREYGSSFARPLFENQIDDWERYDES